MNKLLNIDNVMYRVSDLQEAEKFYIGVLGLKKLWEDKLLNMTGFGFDSDKGKSEIVIHSNPNIPDFDYSYLVEDVISFCGQVREKGYKILLEPIEVRPGKYAVVSDSDGNKIPIIDLTKFGGNPRYS